MKLFIISFVIDEWMARVKHNNDYFEKFPENFPNSFDSVELNPNSIRIHLNDFFFLFIVQLMLATFNSKKTSTKKVN